MSPEVFAPAVFPRLRDAEREGERERARRLGYAEGHAEGFRVATAHAAVAEVEAAAERAEREVADRRIVAEAVAALLAAADALTSRARTLTAASDARVYAHAVELAGIVLDGELADGERSATTAVHRALTAADGDVVHGVRLHPDDLAALQRLDACPDGIVLIADDGLRRGDATAVLEDGFIDARVATALDRARRAIEEAQS